MFKIVSSLVVASLFAAAPASAKTVYTDSTTWLAAVGETPDHSEDFESGYSDNQVFSSSGTMSLSPEGAFLAASFYIEQGDGSIGGSNPIDNFALELPDSGGAIATLTFSSAITYFGFYYIDAASPMLDGTSFASTGASGDTALFGGFTFDVAENKTSITISSVSGDGRWGLDNLTWGYAAPVPLPAGLPLLLAGVGALGVLRRRNRA